MADMEQVLRYKSQLENTPSEERLRHILRKLSRLQMTIDLLQATGIGKAVNAFRKNDGDIGPLAKALVNQWKDLVAELANQEASIKSANQDTEQDHQSDTGNQSDSRSLDEHDRQSKHRSEKHSTNGKKEKDLKYRKLDAQFPSKQSGHRSKEAHASEDIKKRKHREGQSRESALNPDAKRHKHETDGEKRINASSSKDVKPHSHKTDQHAQHRESGSNKNAINTESQGRHDQHRHINKSGTAVEHKKEKGSISEKDGRRQKYDVIDKYSGKSVSKESDKSRKLKPEHRELIKQEPGCESDGMEDNSDVNSTNGDSSDLPDLGFDDESDKSDHDSDKKYVAMKMDQQKYGKSPDLTKSPRKLKSKNPVKERHGSHEKDQTKESGGSKSHNSQHRHDREKSNKSDSSVHQESNDKDVVFGSLFSSDQQDSGDISETKEKGNSVERSKMKDSKRKGDQSERSLNYDNSDKFENSFEKKSIHKPTTSGIDSADSKKHVEIDTKPKTVTIAADDENGGLSFEDFLSYDQPLVNKVMKKKKTTSSETSKLNSSYSKNRSVKQSSQSANSHTKLSEKEKRSHKGSNSATDSEKKHSVSHKHDQQDSHKPSSSHQKESSTSHKKESSNHSKGNSSHKKESSSHKKDSSSLSKGSSSHNKESSSHRNGKSSSSSKRRKPETSEGSFLVPSPPKVVRLTDADIMGYLPETQAHYKPLRLHDIDGETSKHSRAAEVDPMLIGSKSHSRTQVYSGRRNVGISEMQSLFDQCMRVLMDHIDNLDYVGGVPYSILKPVLEKCSAEQLYRLEDYNPQFLEESDELWQILSNRDFRGNKPDEMESWRELYLRMYDEREAKLQKLKANIAASEEARKAPVRLTKLAYVDTVAKPPRDVLRKQLKYGTATVNMSPSSSKPNPAGYQRSSLKSRLTMDMGPIAPPRKGTSVKVVAPMMQKTMKMIKKLRR